MKQWYPVLVCVCIALFSVRYFLTPSFIPTHDAEYHVIRLWQFDKNIREGILLPVWAPDLNHGLGVPLFEFFYPLPNYIAEFFYLLGFSLIGSIKVTLAFGVVAASFFMYQYLRNFLSTPASIIGSVSYILAPYYLVDTHIRGSVGEVWALALAPLALFFLKKMAQRNTYAIFSGVILSLMFLSHTTVGGMLGMFCLFYSLCSGKITPRLLLLSGVVVVIAVLLSLFYILPVAVESRFIQGLDIVNYRDHFPDSTQLVFPSWGSGFSVPGIGDQMSFQVGLVHIAGVIAGIICWLRKKTTNIILLIGVFLLSIIFMLDISLPVWEILTPLKYLQFPWRLLSISVLTSSLLLAYVTNRYPRPAGLLFITILLAYIPYTQTTTYGKRLDSFYLANPSWTNGTATTGNSFNTRWTGISAVSGEFVPVSGAAEITDVSRSVLRSSARITSTETVSFVAKRAYFPGWQFVLDGKKADIVLSDTGTIQFTVPPGKHSIMIEFTNTFARTVGNSVSFGTLVVVSLYLFKKRYDYRT